MKGYGILWYLSQVAYVNRYTLMSWYKPKKKTSHNLSIHNYNKYRRNWKEMVDKEASDLYYKQYRRELYLDMYLVTLRYKKPKATWVWLDY